MNYFNSAVVENVQSSKDLGKNRSDRLLIPKIQKTKKIKTLDSSEQHHSTEMMTVDKTVHLRVALLPP